MREAQGGKYLVGKGKGIKRGRKEEGKDEEEGKRGATENVYKIHNK